MRWLGMAGMAVLLAGCGEQQPSDSGANAYAASSTAVPSPAATLSDAEPAATKPKAIGAAAQGKRPETQAADQGGSVPRDCRLEVDGKTHVQGRCLVFPGGDGGGYTLNTWSSGKPRQSHFAVVVLLANGTAEASWNADPDDDRAGDPLGAVRMEGGCWVNQRARICAR